MSECVITYDGVPTYSISIMEFIDGLVSHETQYFADPFDAPARVPGWPSRCPPTATEPARLSDRRPDPGAGARRSGIEDGWRRRVGEVARL